MLLPWAIGLIGEHFRAGDRHRPRPGGAAVLMTAGTSDADASTAFLPVRAAGLGVGLCQRQPSTSCVRHDRSTTCVSGSCAGPVPRPVPVLTRVISGSGSNSLIVASRPSSCAGGAVSVTRSRAELSTATAWSVSPIRSCRQCTRRRRSSPGHARFRSGGRSQRRHSRLAAALLRRCHPHRVRPAPAARPGPPRTSRLPAAPPFLAARSRLSGRSRAANGPTAVSRYCAVHRSPR